MMTMPRLFGDPPHFGPYVEFFQDGCEDWAAELLIPPYPDVAKAERLQQVAQLIDQATERERVPLERLLRQKDPDHKTLGWEVGLMDVIGAGTVPNSIAELMKQVQEFDIEKWQEEEFSNHH
jgi:hypothetical protein